MKDSQKIQLCESKGCRSENDINENTNFCGDSAARAFCAFT